MEFIGREAELRSMRKVLGRNGQEVLLVYGRRRIGKSELIKQAVRGFDGPCIYYECKQTTEANNVESLSALISEEYGYPSLAMSGIEEALDFLFEKAHGGPTALILDEYSYLRDAVKGLDSIVQAVVDRHADLSSMKLVLCGSYIEVMRSLLEESNPLFGRVGYTLKLSPMDYYDTAGFFPSFSDEDKVKLYSVFGGVPYYNRLVDPSASVRENIMELVTIPGARLQTEVSMFLRAEISKITNANETFEALAQGYSRYKDILDQSHVSSGPTLVDVLKKLVGMELVEKTSPINAPNDRKKASYRIVDPLSRFFYRYVSRFLSQIQFMSPDAFFDRYVSDDFESNYVPHAFEDMCRQYLVRKNRAGELAEPFELIGRYYYDDPAERTNGEFDVVTYGENGYAFYEAKFRKTPVTDRMVSEEIDQVRATSLECYKYGFFSRSGFSADQRSDTEFITLSQMYA